MTPDSASAPLASFLRAFTLFQRTRLAERLPGELANLQEQARAIGGLIGFIPLGGVASFANTIASTIKSSKTAADRMTEIVADDSIVYDFLEFMNKQHIDIALNELASIVKTIDSAKTLASDISMGRFTSGREKSGGHTVAEPLSEEAAGEASDRFRRFLEREGLGQSEAIRIATLHDKFVKKEMPELSVLAAAQELREQFNPKPVIAKAPYPGKRLYPDAKKFLVENYAEDIAAGKMTTGRLQKLDSTLYVTLTRELEGSDETLAELLEPKGKPYARRAIACAAILGTKSTEDAGRFFGGIRADRIAKHPIR